MMFYQILSRNNNCNGRAYRLVLIYNTNGAVVRCIEFYRTVCSHDVSSLYPDINQLETIHLSTSEYNRLKKRYSEILKTL